MSKEFSQTPLLFESLIYFNVNDTMNKYYVNSTYWCVQTKIYVNICQCLIVMLQKTLWQFNTRTGNSPILQREAKQKESRSKHQAL